MATGFNNTGSYDPDMPLEVTTAIIPPRKGAMTLEEAQALLRRTKQYMDECDERDAKAKLARGNADTMEMPAQAISSKNTLQPNADAIAEYRDIREALSRFAVFPPRPEQRKSLKRLMLR